LFAVLAVGFTALLAAGCAAPGANRIAGPPEGLPPSLDYVTADVLGFTLYDTDPGSKLWGGVEAVRAESTLAELYDAIGMTADEVEPWIGDHAGVAVRQLDVPGVSDDTSVWFADVRSSDALDSALDEAGWSAPSTTSLPKVNRAMAIAWINDDEDATYRAAAVFEDGIVVARSPDGLERFLEAADEYAVPERKAMAQYAVDAVKKVPAAAVFRSDLLRTGVRTPFQEDPALLEFARWVTETDVLVAARDGWVGIAPSTDKDVNAIRMIGSFEWVPDLAPDIDWGSADVDQLDKADSDTDVAVALENPGQHLIELVRGITFGNGQYATDQDVADDGDRVELEPLLEQLDGAATLGWDAREGQLTMQVDGAGDVADDVNEQLCRSGIDGFALDDDGLRVELSSPFLLDEPVDCDEVRLALARKAVPGTAPGRAADAALAGEPPRDPVVWVWTRSLGDCLGPVAGWLTFDGEGEMSFSLRAAVESAAVSTEDSSDPDSRTITAAPCAGAFLAPLP
jgi:hypothetical protein